VCHHTLVHRRLSRVAHGHVAGEEGEHDQRHNQQGQGCHGEADTRGHAVLVPRVLSNGHVNEEGLE
jgi:hypothetical protein